LFNQFRSLYIYKENLHVLHTMIEIANEGNSFFSLAGTCYDIRRYIQNRSPRLFRPDLNTKLFRVINIPPLRTGREIAQYYKEIYNENGSITEAEQIYSETGGIFRFISHYHQMGHSKLSHLPTIPYLFSTRAAVTAITARMLNDPISKMDLIMLSSEEDVDLWFRELVLYEEDNLVTFLILASNEYLLINPK
jgi:hypothetical protein